jgi:hypothetical protein
VVQDAKRAMIAKVQRGPLALRRRAFPADLSGVYSTDEMDQAVEPVTVPQRLPPAGDAKVLHRRQGCYCQG